MTAYTADLQTQILQTMEALAHNERATCNRIEARRLGRAITALQRALVDLDKAEVSLQEAVKWSNAAREVAR